MKESRWQMGVRATEGFGSPGCPVGKSIDVDAGIGANVLHANSARSAAPATST